MIVAMFVVLAVNVPLDDVVDMTLMRNRDVFATDAVLVLRLVGIAAMTRVARLQIARAELVFVEVIAVRVMQMAIVRVIDVIVVPDGHVAACRTVNVFVEIVNVFFCVHVQRLPVPSPACCKPLRIKSATCASARV